MLNWIGIDRSMKMKKTSRAEDKKLQDNNDLEYQIERLHIIGEENKASGLHNKVKGFQFKNKIQVPDAAKKTFTEEPMKPFMVNQLTIAFERNRIILSPYDEVLHKQLIDYEVERISQNGTPVYTSKNEHFIDALGLAYLAFVLEFPTITQSIKQIESTNKILFTNKGFQSQKAQVDLKELSLKTFNDPWKNIKTDPTELKGDKPRYFKTPISPKTKSSSFGWGSRSSTRSIMGNTRSMW